MQINHISINKEKLANFRPRIVTFSNIFSFLPKKKLNQKATIPP